MKRARILTRDGVGPAAIDANGAANDISRAVFDVTAQTVASVGLDGLRGFRPAEFSWIEGEYAPILDADPRIFASG